MLYLILAILSNCTMTFMIKLSNKYKGSFYNINIFNYLFGGGLAYLITPKHNIFSFEINNIFLMFFALINALFYIVCLTLMQINVQKNGAPLSIMYNRIGLIIPILISIIFFRENPSIFQIIGIILALFSIYYLNRDKNKISNFLYLILLFLAGGIVDTIAKVYSIFGEVSLYSTFIFYTFFFSFILSLIIGRKKFSQINKNEILFGALIGVFNQLSTIFQLKAIGILPSYVIFPTYSICIILIVSIINYLVFKEKLFKEQYIGMGVILITLLFLNL